MPTTNDNSSNAQSALLPSELQNCFIGNPINLDTGVFMALVNPLDIGRLREAGMLKVDQPQQRIEILVGTDTGSMIEHTAFSIQGGLSGNFELANVSVQAQAAFANSHANSLFQFTAKAQNYECGGASLQNMDDTATLYKCFSDLFRAKYNAVVNATTAKEYFENLEHFFQEFGHAVITSVKLIQGAMVDIVYDATTDSTDQKQKYGGSVNAASVRASFNLVAGYTAEQGNRQSSTTLRVTQTIVPSGANASKWAEDFANKYSDMALDDPNAKGGTINNNDFVNVAPIALPTAQPLGDAKLPAAKTKVAEIDEQNRIMDKATDWPAKGDERKWNKYLAWLDGRVKAATDPVAMGAGAGKAKAQGGDEAQTRGGDSGMDAGPSAGGTKPPVASSGPEKDSRTGPAGSANDAAQPPLACESQPAMIQGFVVNDATFTPWTTLFPDLTRTLVPSDYSINVAKAYTFYYSRLEFLQYLQLLGDIQADDGMLVGNDSIGADIEYYGGLLTNLQQALTTQDFSDGNAFDKLAAMATPEPSQFFSCHLHDAFFDPVIHRVLHASPLGLVVGVSPVHLSVDWHDLKSGMPLKTTNEYDNGLYVAVTTDDVVAFRDLPRPTTVMDVLFDALRVCPILQLDGQAVKLAAFTSSWIDAASIPLEGHHPYGTLAFDMPYAPPKAAANASEFFAGFTQETTADVHAFRRKGLAQVTCRCPAGVTCKISPTSKDGASYWYYAAGFDDINYHRTDITQLYRGAPMFQQFDYERLKRRLRFGQQ